MIMKKIILIGAAVLLIGGLTARADNMSTTESTNVDLHLLDSNSDSLYRNYELDLNVFGVIRQTEVTGAIFDHHSYPGHPSGGLGAALDFFFCKYIGIEAEGFSVTTHNSWVNNAGGNMILRLPIGNSGFAPYVFGGGGHQFFPGPSTYYGGGIGLEYRFTKCIGIFGDGRYAQVDDGPNFILGRVGLNFSF